MNEANQNERMVIRAYRVSAHGAEAITFARSRGSAKYHCYRSATAAGYQTKFGDITAKRAPEHDDRTGKYLIVGPCYSLEYLSV